MTTSSVFVTVEFLLIELEDKMSSSTDDTFVFHEGKWSFHTMSCHNY